MVGDMGHMGGLINHAPGADNTEPVFQIPVGLPNLERGRRDKKGTYYSTEKAKPLRRSFFKLNRILHWPI